MASLKAALARDSFARRTSADHLQRSPGGQVGRPLVARSSRGAPPPSSSGGFVSTASDLHTGSSSASSGVPRRALTPNRSQAARSLTPSRERRNVSASASQSQLETRAASRHGSPLPRSASAERARGNGTLVGSHSQKRFVASSAAGRSSAGASSRRSKSPQRNLGRNSTDMAGRVGEIAAAARDPGGDLSRLSDEQLRDEAATLRQALALADQCIVGIRSEVTLNRSLANEQMAVQATGKTDMLDALLAEKERLQAAARTGWASAHRLQSALRDHEERVLADTEELQDVQRRLETENQRLRKEHAALRTRLLGWKQMQRKLCTASAANVAVSGHGCSTDGVDNGPMVAQGAEGCEVRCNGVSEDRHLEATGDGSRGERHRRCASRSTSPGRHAPVATRLGPYNGDACVARQTHQSASASQPGKRSAVVDTRRSCAEAARPMATKKNDAAKARAGRHDEAAKAGPSKVCHSSVESPAENGDIIPRRINSQVDAKRHATASPPTPEDLAPLPLEAMAACALAKTRAQSALAGLGVDVRSPPPTLESLAPAGGLGDETVEVAFETGGTVAPEELTTGIE
eukprot:TRINITY_DN40417_c0_g2_i1.p1 TRINITY_DN40417_c0_g2~~TRINITY_DN40417_c0_g2_i1.p1  ORF type:complete len:577 (+),score=100.43 TRINITY_DN40417_c0_g2_i1:128-1858(+)